MGGAPVQVVEAGKLGVWASVGGPEPPSADRLREHEVVVRSALESATPIPFRYGTVVRDEKDLVRLVGAREEDYLRMLRELDNRVEMSLRVSIPDDPSLPEGHSTANASSGDLGFRTSGETGPGRAHLEARRGALAARADAEHRLAHLLDDVEADFADMELPAVRLIIHSAGSFGSVAHLVRRDRISAYRERAAAIDRRRGDLRVVATGPWAPYSFVQ